MTTIRRILIFFFLIIASKGFSEESSDPLKIIVSVAPSKYLVEKIGGNYLTCTLFVPPGTSPHSYEPSLRQVIDNSNATIWFRVGENFETRIVKLLENKMTIVDLRNNLPLLTSRCSCHDVDTHIWLSPKLLKLQVDTICHTLSQLAPEHAAEFQKNSDLLTQDLSALDQEICEQFKDAKRNSFLASHPAFGYFCRDYGLHELSIEIEGKEPTPKQITCLLNEAKEKHVDLVITQPQYSNRGALHLAKELNAKIVSIDPYQENVVENLRTLATAIAK